MWLRAALCCSPSFSLSLPVPEAFLKQESPPGQKAFPVSLPVHLATDRLLVKPEKDTRPPNATHKTYKDAVP